jgi:hypothetical protein
MHYGRMVEVEFTDAAGVVVQFRLAKAGGFMGA